MRHIEQFGNAESRRLRSRCISQNFSLSVDFHLYGTTTISLATRRRVERDATFATTVVTENLRTKFHQTAGHRKFHTHFRTRHWQQYGNSTENWTILVRTLGGKRSNGRSDLEISIPVPRSSGLVPWKVPVARERQATCAARYAISTVRAQAKNHQFISRLRDATATSLFLHTILHHFAAIPFQFHPDRADRSRVTAHFWNPPFGLALVSNCDVYWKLSTLDV